MKKLLFFASLAVFAIGAGGHMIGTAHAQTTSSAALTPAEQAALQQQLDVAKAQLANLQMEAGNIPSGDTGSAAAVPATTSVAPTATASTGLTADQVTALKGTLATLATMLTQLNASIAADTSLTASQQTAIAATLSSMNNVLVSMVSSVQSTNVSGGEIAAANTSAAPTVAQSNTNGTSMSAGVAANTTPSVSDQNSPVSQPVATDNSNANSAPAQTAQASGIWSFAKDHWPTVVIVLLVLAILAILFWPEKETTVVKTISTGNQGSGKPKTAPTPAPSVNVSPAAPTPMANAAGSVHK